MKDDFYVLGIVLTAILGAWNLANNYRLSRRTAFINTVTAERVKWIERLRDNLSKFCSLVLTWNALEGLGAPASAEQMKEIIRLQYVIRLQLNPAGDHDKEIERLVLEIPKLTDPDKVSGNYHLDIANTSCSFSRHFGWGASTCLSDCASWCRRPNPKLKSALGIQGKSRRLISRWPNRPMGWEPLFDGA